VLRVFAILIQEHFRFEAQWYRTGVVAGLVLQYYALLRSVLRTRAELRRCLTRCRHCGIFFVAAACNVGRKLGCPFGCAQAHRKQQCRQSSHEFYQSDVGKRKKSALNQRRKINAPSSPPVPPPVPSAPPVASAPSPAPSAPPALPPPATEIPVPIPELLVSYVQRVVSAIEGRAVSREEILAMLAKEKRQHSMVRQRRIDHIIRSLHEQPP
jgi:hypothetical protein